ncbi:MAG: fumarylacetoacetate hydrolase family protein [Caulobacterales bacterium]|nr:fumarylacetoacetate hydrolase family protein [Caulobacterales bacterium]
MTDYIFSPPERVSLPINGSDARFPVRRILCVGQNYAGHAREMGADPSRRPPFFFSKPADALVPGGGEVPYPSVTRDLHHEVELVVAIGHGGSQLDALSAERLIAGWAVGVDLTRRDLQAEAKAAGRPWDAAKGFDFSAPIAPLIQSETHWRPAGAVSLAVNGAVRQAGNLADMIWSPAEVVAQASTLWRLAPGDLIFTGTPEGVGPLVRGDHVRAEIDGLPPLEFTMV